MSRLPSYSWYVSDVNVKSRVSLNNFVRPTFPWGLSCEVDAEGTSRQKAISFYSMRFERLLTLQYLSEASNGLWITLVVLIVVTCITSFFCCGFCGLGFGSFNVMTTVIVCDSVLIDASRKMLVAVEKN